MGKSGGSFHQGDGVIIPLNVRFDRMAQLTDGLVQVSSESPFILDPTGIALVTGFLTGSIWNACYDPISTGWTACYADVTTGWTACFSNPQTGWTLCS